MSGSSDFRLELAPSFEASLLALEKATYHKSDAKGRALFRELMERTIEQLFGYPQIAGCRSETFPPGIGESSTAAGWLFHKIEFSTPRAGKSARQGRFMFLVHREQRLLVPLYVYTHAQFPSRVPDGTLRDLIQAVRRNSEELAVPAAPKVVAPTTVAEPSTAPQGPDETE